MDKYKSTFFNNCCEWLFSREERQPVNYIGTFFLIVIMSTVISMFVFALGKHLMY